MVWCGRDDRMNVLLWYFPGSLTSYMSATSLTSRESTAAYMISIQPLKVA